MKWLFPSVTVLLVGHHQQALGSSSKGSKAPQQGKFYLESQHRFAARRSTPRRTNTSRIAVWLTPNLTANSASVCLSSAYSRTTSTSWVESALVLTADSPLAA
jgi:hypothetical protein